MKQGSELVIKWHGWSEALCLTYSAAYRDEWYISYTTLHDPHVYLFVLCGQKKKRGNDMKSLKLAQLYLNIK